MSTTIQPVQPQIVVPWKSTSAIKQRAEAIQQLLKEVMNEATQQSNWDGDFGKIPGTGGKPSLLKAGSEKILAMFEMAVDPVVEDLSTDDCCRYRVTCRILHAPSGNFLGAGVGECSTNETKYKWKRTYSKKEYDATDPDRRKIKFSQFKGNNGMWEDKEEYLIRTEPADLANTVLKMAKKRAQIDATLTVTGASSMFTQDELEPETEVGGAQAPSKGKKSGKSSPKATEDVKCAHCGAVNGHLPSCKYHPKNQSGTGQSAAASPAPQQAASVQGEVMPKKESEVPKSTTQESFFVKTCNKKKSGRGGDYLELIGTDESNNDGWRYVWHGHLQKDPADLSTSVGKLCVWDISGTKKGDKIYFSVEKIHSIGTQAYIDDLPVQAPNAQEVGFDAAPPDEAW